LQLRRRGEETYNFHLFGACVRQHVHLSLREQYSATGFYSFYLAVHHYFAGSADDVDRFFAVGVRMRRLDGFAWRNLDHAHRTMYGIDVVLCEQPSQAAARQLQYFHFILVDDRYFHVRTPSRSQTVRAIAAGVRPNASISSS